MNDAGTLPRHMLDIRELTAEAFAPYGQVIAPQRTGGQGAETGYDPETAAGEAKLVLGDGGNGEPRLWIMHLPHVGARLHPDRTASAGHAMPGVARRQRMADRRGATGRPW
jgi:hypothetical protein